MTLQCDAKNDVYCSELVQLIISRTFLSEPLRIEDKYFESFAVDPIMLEDEL